MSHLKLANQGHGSENRAPGQVPRPSNGPRSGSGASTASNTVLAEKSSFENEFETRKKSDSVSSHAQTGSSSRRPSNATKPGVRTIPPWIHPVDEDDKQFGATSQLLPPDRIRNATHHYLPAPRSDAATGRQFDYARERTPALQSRSTQDQAFKWHNFIQASAWGQPETGQGEVVSEEWMQKNLPDLDRPWAPHEIEKDRQKDPRLWQKGGLKSWKQRHYRTIMRNAMIPLIVRLTVLAFSALALGFAGSVFHHSNQNHCDQSASTYLAIIIDTVAIFYTLYITWDEYTSKPIGLRSASAKLRLLFLDILFIIFDSANLSLAFDALRDARGPCFKNTTPGGACDYNAKLCGRQKTLAAVLFIALLAWLFTFTISILRIVERVVGRDSDTKGALDGALDGQLYEMQTQTA